MYLNVSMSSTEFRKPWQELKDRGKISDVYVGGFSCSGGVWRSSENSLMKGMDEGFNIFEPLFNLFTNEKFPGKVWIFRVHRWTISFPG